MRTILLYLTAIVLAVWAPHHCTAYFVRVDADDKECFFEVMTESQRLMLDFEITEGGFLDIDVQILNPNNEEINFEERKTRGRYEFPADRPGPYSFCFINKMSTLTTKVVKFDASVKDASVDLSGSGVAAAAANKSDSEVLQTMIGELQYKLNLVYQEQEYMNVRDRIHRSINENTNTRVMLWSFFEAFILGLMAVGQVYYLKKFFEVRRVV